MHKRRLFIAQFLASNIISSTIIYTHSTSTLRILRIEHIVRSGSTIMNTTLYKPTPARSEPAPTSAPRGPSSGHRVVETRQTARTVSSRSERNSPTPVLLVRRGPPPHVPSATGPSHGNASSATPTTHVRPHPARPQLRRQHAEPRPRSHPNAVYVPGTLRRIVISNQTCSVELHVDSPRSAGRSPRRVVIRLESDARDDPEDRDDEDEINYDDPPPRYSLHPQDLHCSLPENPAQLRSGHPRHAPPPYERHIAVRRVEGSAIRAPRHVTSPGVPLASSASQIRTRIYRAAYEHDADYVAAHGWMAWMGLRTLFKMWPWDVLPVTIPSAPRFPFIERFVNDPLYQQ